MGTAQPAPQGNKKEATTLSKLGVGAFQYEAQKLLGIKIDVIPTFALQNVEDQAFVRSVRLDSVAIGTIRKNCATLL
jgi:hypothetical protein